MDELIEGALHVVRNNDGSHHVTYGPYGQTGVSASRIRRIGATDELIADFRKMGIDEDVIDSAVKDLTKNNHVSIPHVRLARPVLDEFGLL